jgi:hypothetical protein
MIYSTHDTSWALSAKGNYWRRLNGQVLVVGQSKTNDNYWAMRDGEFLKGKFFSRVQAQHAAEAGTNGVVEQSDLLARSERSGDVH